MVLLQVWVVLEDTVWPSRQFALAIQRQSHPAGINYQLITMWVVTYDPRCHLHRNVLQPTWTSDVLLNIWRIQTIHKLCNGLSRLKLNELFTLDDNNRGTRGHSWKLAKFRCTRDCCIFSNRVINRWNQLDQRAVGAWWRGVVAWRSGSVVGLDQRS